MRESWSPRGSPERGIACLDLSRNQSLREQRAPTNDQDVKGQGWLWSQADLALPS